MVSPAGRRAWIAWVVEAFRVPVRRACRATGVARSLITYRSGKAPQTALRARLKELAAVRVSYGYKRLYILLRREGWRVNHKRIYRLYGEEALELRRRRPRRRKSAVVRGPRLVPGGPNEVWAMDFMHDTLVDGRLLRVLTLIDSYTRECLALVARSRFRGEDVAAVLEHLGHRRALPARLTVDNGTEFTSRALDAWAYWNRVQLDFSRPGKPVDNCLIEAFNGSLRRECLSQHWFASLPEAQQILEAWRMDYNTERPHRSLALRSPAEQIRGGHFIPGPNRLVSCPS
jgi:putative transposase